MSFAGFISSQVSSLAQQILPSLPAAGFFGLSSAELGLLGPGLIRADRSIQDLVPDVVVEERHNDRLTITQHPVEKSASITDHAYKEPPIVTIRAGWSASSPAAGGDPNYPQDIYEQLRDYQDSVTLLEVMTGKRQYENLLLVEIEITTDQSSEYALMASLTFQQVVLVETETVSVPSNDVQAGPEATGTTVDRGTQAAKPAAPKINAPALAKSMANSASIPWTVSGVNPSIEHLQ